MKMFIVTSAALALLGSAAAGQPVAPAEPDPKAMSQSEIRAFNAKLDKDHKYFIRCKRSASTGSYAKREYSCRTNEKWAAADAAGNQEARDIAERMASKAASGN
jgi:hypothetical protein